MKVYGSDICIDCRNYKALASGRNLEAEYIDITENTPNLLTSAMNIFLFDKVNLL